MPVGLAPSSIADLRQLGDAYKDAEKVIQKRLRAGLQAAAKPLAERVVKEGSESLPAGGGLRSRIAASRGTVGGAIGAGSVVSLTIQIQNRQRDAVGALDSGTLLHPVWKTGVWVTQSVPADQFSQAFSRSAPAATDRVNDEIGRAVSEIASDGP